MSGVEVGHSQVRDRSFPAETFRVRPSHRCSRDARIATSGTAAGPRNRPRGVRGAAPTPARTTSGVMAPGSGTHFVKTFGLADAASPNRPEKAAGDQLGTAIVIRHVERIESGLARSRPAHRRRHRDPTACRRVPCPRPARVRPPCGEYRDRRGNSIRSGCCGSVIVAGHPPEADSIDERFAFSPFKRRKRPIRPQCRRHGRV